VASSLPAGSTLAASPHPGGFRERCSFPGRGFLFWWFWPNRAQEDRGGWLFSVVEMTCGGSKVDTAVLTIQG
jgi:hypothetical protein